MACVSPDETETTNNIEVSNSNQMEHRVQQPKKKRKQTSTRISRLATDTRRQTPAGDPQMNYYKEHRVQQPDKEEQTDQMSEWEAFGLVVLKWGLSLSQL